MLWSPGNPLRHLELFQLRSEYLSSTIVHHPKVLITEQKEAVATSSWERPMRFLSYIPATGDNNRRLPALCSEGVLSRNDVIRLFSSGGGITISGGNPGVRNS